MSTRPNLKHRMREAGGGKRGLPLGVAAGLPHTMRLN